MGYSGRSGREDSVADLPPALVSQEGIQVVTLPAAERAGKSISYQAAAASMPPAWWRARAAPAALHCRF